MYRVWRSGRCPALRDEFGDCAFAGGELVGVGDQGRELVRPCRLERHGRGGIAVHPRAALASGLRRSGLASAGTTRSRASTRRCVMRIPVQSETDAFRLTYGIAVAVAV